MRLADVSMSQNVVDLCECLPEPKLMQVLEIAMNTMLVAGLVLLLMLVVDVATTSLEREHEG